MLSESATNGHHYAIDQKVVIMNASKSVVIQDDITKATYWYERVELEL